MANPPHILHEQDIRKVVRDETGPKDSTLKAILSVESGGLRPIGNAFNLEFYDPDIYTNPGAAILAFDQDGLDAHFVEAIPDDTNNLFVPNTTDHDRHDNVGVVFDEDGLTYKLQVIPGDESAAHPYEVHFQIPTTWTDDYEITLNYTVNESTDPGHVGNQLQMTPGFSIAEIQTQLDYINLNLTASGVDGHDFTLTSTENHHLSFASITPNGGDPIATSPSVIIIDRGSSGYGDLITGNEAGIDRFFSLSEVTNPSGSTSWDDVTAIDVRSILHPNGLWDGGLVTRGTTFVGDLAKENVDGVDIFYASASTFLEDDSAGFFGSGQTRDNRPTIDIAAITDPTLQSIAQGLADFGIIRDANA